MTLGAFVYITCGTRWPCPVYFETIFFEIYYPVDPISREHNRNARIDKSRGGDWIERDFVTAERVGQRGFFFSCPSFFFPILRPNKKLVYTSRQKKKKGKEKKETRQRILLKKRLHTTAAETILTFFFLFITTAVRCDHHWVIPGGTGTWDP